MKNVTITLEEDVARWARVWAAEHETSVSRMLGEALKEKMQQEGRYGRAQAQYFAQAPKALKTSETRYPKRGELYDR
jgi:plasmid stability protein